MSVYQFSVRNQQGQEVSLQDYAGQVLLVVNTATHCGFTPQYVGLMELYEAMKDKGFVVLDFPCDQFGGQAPGDDQQINQFCVSRYAIEFPQFSKIKVNGKEADPLFQYLKKQAPGAMGSAIKWNFTKFLVNRQGEVVRRYAPNTPPKEIENDIMTLLSDK